MCVACGDSVAEVATDGSGTTSGTTATAGTTAAPTTTSSTTEADSGVDVDSGLGTTSTTSGEDSTTSGTTGSGDTGSTGEPVHETDFGLCEIVLECGQPLVDEPKRSCNLTVIEGDGYVVYDGAAGLENRGRSSQGWPKHQYSVELWSTPNVELVAPGSTWRYNDTASAGGADWMSPGFDDGGWAQGPAPLGYGVIGPQWQRWGEPWATVAQIANATTIGFGPDSNNKHITSWYRQEFEVTGAAGLDPVVLDVRADDGLVVYINGVEAARFNMPTGPIDQNTTAATTIESLEEVEFSDFPIDTALFVEGTNVIAVEVHQYAGNSSDVVMDLALSTKPPEAPTNFFEFGAESDWIFNGMYFDLSLYRNKLIYDLFTAFDPAANYGPQGHYCELTLDGDWRGIYTLGEKIKRDDDRVDIAEEIGGGQSFIFKSDITKQWVVTNGIGWQLIYPSVHGMSQSTADGFNAFMSGFGAATAGAGNVWDYVDMASAVDWVLVQELTRNGDAYYSSMHIFKDAFGKIKFVPWDFDIGMGGGCGGTEGWIGRPQGFWLNAMTGDPVFQAAFVARYNELRMTVLSQAEVDARVDAYAATMTPEKIAQNFERWPQDEIIGGDDWVLPFREGCPVATWEEEHDLVQQWLADRLIWMDENIQTFN